MIDLFDLYFYEDCPYQDESAELLRLEGWGKMRIVSRENGTCACAGELAEYYERKGLKIRNYLEDGMTFKPGDAIFEAEGDLKLLFKLWRVSQTFLSLMCAISTKTASLVSAGRKANPDLIIATSRKTHPGSRIFELKAVRAGGGDIHRNSLSDSIQLSQNHLEVAGELGKLRAMKKIEIEPRTRKEAFKYVEMSNIMLLDHLSPEELRELGPELKKINPKLELAVGGIEAKRIPEYAPFVDIIVISAPYYANPLDFTTKIERL
ncbi:Molybdenum transport system protein ModD [Methanosarcina horonobensis HB-1 = JCM 15518]|uniref:Nicotinate-nucleotide pyrophosphorylase [carboxylating] n=1 Tax=Methanosarcina horonobensis HB-1 = JCM 15518 TaxID=1434110 RepID=A0A0E3SIF2_9EURY|nr:nicotinate-nucleotide pyrophosphorylase [Methanosarcina horonobensis]AKB80297.1 Molybdenum transport system protein ModD [Methanosarcina horonobensis HB-1 = JCM 15518]